MAEKLTFNVWCRVEVVNEKETTCQDLDPGICEYKIFQSDDLEDVAKFIIQHQQSLGNAETGVLLELEDAMQHQGLIQGE